MSERPHRSNDRIETGLGRPADMAGAHIGVGKGRLAPELDRAIRFDDPDIGIEWPVDHAKLTLSDRDRQAPRLADAETF